MEDSKKVRDRLTFNPADNTSNEEMNQEHFEICEGTVHERRGLDMGTWRGLLDLWRRMLKKLGATEPEEVHQPGILHDMSIYICSKFI